MEKKNNNITIYDLYIAWSAMACGLCGNKFEGKQRGSQPFKKVMCPN
jgi:hypothetical protein